MFKVISASSILRLEEEAENYDIESLGSLCISNSYYHLGIIGNLKKVPEVNPSLPLEPAISKPKPRAKRSKINV